MPENFSRKIQALLREVLILLGYDVFELRIWAEPLESDLAVSVLYHFDVEVELYGATRTASGSFPVHLFDCDAAYARIARFILDRIGL